MEYKTPKIKYILAIAMIIFGIALNVHDKQIIDLMQTIILIIISIYVLFDDMWGPK